MTAYHRVNHTVKTWLTKFGKNYYTVILPDNGRIFIIDYYYKENNISDDLVELFVNIDEGSASTIKKVKIIGNNEKYQHGSLSQLLSLAQNWI